MKCFQRSYTIPYLSMILGETPIAVLALINEGELKAAPEQAEQPLQVNESNLLKFLSRKVRGENHNDRVS
jgi:hypothetical protein